jgi:hypothetical protein
MSSTSSIDWALDKVAEFAVGHNGDDPALEVLLALVGGMNPQPKPVKLEPTARRIGKLRLARVLDHPGDLRVGAVRLLAALDAPSSSGAVAESVVKPKAKPVAGPRTAESDAPRAEELPAAPPRARTTRSGAGRVVLSFPTTGEETAAEASEAESRTGPELTATLQRSAAKAGGAFGKAIGQARANGKLAGKTKDELYSLATKLGIEGRSKMSKRQLERAIAKAR